MSDCGFSFCCGCLCHINPPCIHCVDHIGICYVCQENEVQEGWRTCTSCGEDHFDRILKGQEDVALGETVCQHEFQHYQGFVDSYLFCKKCDHKENYK